MQQSCHIAKNMTAFGDYLMKHKYSLVAHCDVGTNTDAELQNDIACAPKDGWLEFIECRGIVTCSDELGGCFLILALNAISHFGSETSCIKWQGKNGPLN